MDFPPIPLLEGSLWLGSVRDASNLGWLKSQGIRNVVNVGHTPGRPSWVRRDGTKAGEASDWIKSYTEVNPYDAHGYPILQNHLHEVEPVLQKLYKDGERTLINCHQGINRSTTLAVAFLANLTGAPVEEIIALIRPRRPVLSNVSFVQQLLAWDQAKHQK